jgi:hypothetical protein
MAPEPHPHRARRRLGAALICVAFASLVALWSNYQIHLLPPGLSPRALEMASASTSMLVDTPVASLVDQRQDTYAFGALQDRAVLLGTVMANGPLKAAIARQAGIPVDSLRVEAPMTRDQPRMTVEPGREKKAGDILKSNDQYRLDVEVNPTVPVLDVYVLAPTAAAAQKLANATFAASRQYLDRLETSEATPDRVRLKLTQMGGARGDVINQGAAFQIAAVAFMLALALSGAVFFAVARIRRGWRVAVFTERVTSS